MSTTAGPDWLEDDESARSLGQVALDVLEGPDVVGFASVGGPAGAVAKGRVTFASDGTADWMGITNLWVHPSHRRQGLGVVVVGALLEWGAERGATTAYLQTRGDNPGALALYDRLGFVTHHAYRYLTTA